jgi:prephenate dehydratase
MSDSSGRPLRVGFLGPEGTFSHEAVLSSPRSEDFELIELPTIVEAILAVEDGTVERALVPIENSIEGSVSVTLDALAFETESVTIIGEAVQPISQCLIAPQPIPLDQVEVVVSHPQASAQCARFVRTEMPQARVMATSSTADAVRVVAEHGHGWVALGPRLAAARYGCEVLRDGVEDRAGNETRFVWLAPRGTRPGVPGAPADPAAPRKTAIVFWGAGTGAAGWLVDCLSELSGRGVNMTRIESRPRKRALGEYMFFVDCTGTAEDPRLVKALVSLKAHVEVLRVLGSFPSA